MWNNNMPSTSPIGEGSKGGKFPRGTTTSSIHEGTGTRKQPFGLNHPVIGIDHLVKKNKDFSQKLNKWLVQAGPRADRYKWSDMSSP